MDLTLSSLIRCNFFRSLALNGIIINSWPASTAHLKTAQARVVSDLQNESQDKDNNLLDVELTRNSAGVTNLRVISVQIIVWPLQLTLQGNVRSFALFLTDSFLHGVKTSNLILIIEI